MVCTAPLEEIAVVGRVPDTYRDFSELHYRNILLLNEPPRKSHRSAEQVLFQNDMLSIGIELNRLLKLYKKKKKVFAVNFKTFYDAYLRMSRMMDAIVPEYCHRLTEVSVDEECLYNYYEFDNNKIFFNLFFDEDSVDPVAQINANSNGKFISIEGSIETAADKLKKAL